MHASPAVPDVEAGRYICIRTRSLPGALIRLVTHSRYDHAVISTGSGHIIEARAPGGVRASSLSAYAGCAMAADTAEDLTAAERAAVVAAARAREGEGYDYAQLADDALAQFGLPWRWLLRWTFTARRLVCSELVAECGVAAGLDSWSCGKPVAAVTPADLARRPGVHPADL